MSELLNAINFLEIQNTKGGNRNEARLRDLEGRAQFLAKKTGQEPVSWYEFTREVPPEKPKTFANAAIGAGIGAVVLGGFAAATGGTALVLYPALSGAVLGGLLGGYHKTENTSRSRQVDAYEQYLSQFESAQSLGINKEPSGLNTQFNRIHNQEAQFTEALVAQREAEKKDHGCGCGKGK